MWATESCGARPVPEGLRASCDPTQRPSVPPVRAFLALLWSVVALMPPLASAHSLRCAGNLVSEGDSKLLLLRTCGRPALVDLVCIRDDADKMLRDWAKHVGVSTIPACLEAEDWLYQQEPGDLPTTVRVRDGRIISITYGRASHD